MNPVQSTPAAAVRRIPQQPGERRQQPGAEDQFRRALAERGAGEQGAAGDRPDGEADGGGRPATESPATVSPVTESPVTAALQRQLARSRKVPRRTDDGAPPRHIDVLA
ncbi:MAG: hypothetical protein AB7O97_13830 [Planctomycetota bacterium]